MEVPTLQEAAPAKFDDDGVHALFEAIDQGFGDICVRFAKVSGDGIDGIQLEGLCGREAPLLITRECAPRIELLRDKTLPDQVARVAGTKVPARIEHHEPNALRGLWPGEESEDELLEALQAIE